MTNQRREISWEQSTCIDIILKLQKIMWGWLWNTATQRGTCIPYIVDVYRRSSLEAFLRPFCSAWLPFSHYAQNVSTLLWHSLRKRWLAGVCLVELWDVSLPHSTCGSLEQEMKTDFRHLSWQMHRQQNIQWSPELPATKREDKRTCELITLKCAEQHINIFINGNHLNYGS